MQLVKLLLRAAAAAAAADADAAAAAAAAAAGSIIIMLDIMVVMGGGLWGFFQNDAAHCVLGQRKSWLQDKISGNNATPGTTFGFFDAS
jgi:hypothetical protein